MATVISTTASRILRRTQPRSAAAPASSLTQEESAGQVAEVRIAPPPAFPPPTPPPSRVHIVEHPAAQHALTVLCNRQSGNYQMRSSSNHLLVALTLEAMRSLPTRPHRPEPGRDAWTGVVLAKPVVLLSVTRHGLSLSHNLLDCVPGLLVGSITLGRPEDEGSSHARLHLASAPALRDCRVLLFMPVIQSGASALAALDLVRQLGATDAAILSFTTSAQGLLRLQSADAGLSVWTAHVDAEWDAKRSPVSVLGDFGTRLFA